MKQVYYTLLFLLALLPLCAKCSRKYIATLERLEVTAPTEGYIANLQYSYKKANRTSPYFVNIAYDILKAWDRNVTMNIKSYEWKDNQYKESLIAYENELCHLLKNDVFVFTIVRQYSNLPKKCPVPVGHFAITNLIMDAKYLPPYLPISKWSLVLRYFHAKLKEDIIIAKVFLKIEENLQVKQKKKA